MIEPLSEAVIELAPPTKSSLPAGPIRSDHPVIFYTRGNTKVLSDILG